MIRRCQYCGSDYVAEKGSHGHCSVQCRFWDKVEVKGREECWPWTGAINRKGRGQFRHPETHWAHRAAYILASGECIPPDMVVMHRCDNPRCCNPGHLSLGTQIENIADRHSKGRSRAPHGEYQGSAKLTDDAVKRIRADHQPVEILASIYGVSKSTIFRVKSRSTWSHI